MTVTETRTKSPQAGGPSRLFLYHAAAMMAVLLSLWIAVGTAQRALTNKGSRVVLAHETGALKRLIEEDVQDLVAHLFVAARSPLHTHTGPQAQKLLASQWALQLEERKEISQIRLLDAWGRELIRVVRGQGGQPVIASADELQDKHRRYYYQNARGLAPGEVYMSPLDLNVENNAIELPWHPTLRLVTKLVDDGQSTRFVVINFNASIMLARFDAAPEANVERFLVNADGHLLAGGTRESRWGFMFKRTAWLPKAWPAFWKNMQEGEAGTQVLPSEVLSWVMPAAVMSFIDVVPGRFIARDTNLQHSIVGGERWWIVCRQRLPTPFVLTWDRCVTLILLVGFSLVVAWFWSGAIVARQLAEAEAFRAQQELIRSERMASLGNLVAGVAHELNTPIGNALTTASCLAEQTQAISDEISSGKLKKSSILDFIEAGRSGNSIVLRNLERAAQLVGRFKAVAVDQASEARRSFALGTYLQEVGSTLRPMFKGHVLLVSQDSVAQMDSYPGALSQVVINLVTNALTHGIHDKPGGVVTIRSYSQDLNTAVVVVQDDGDGIPAHHLERIFEPFFTTRLGEGGSGLGLSITQNIVQSVLGGEITVETEPGQYTRFYIRIPKRAPQQRLADRDPHHVVRPAA